MLLKAIEEKTFPLGSDREVTSQFQLIAGTHRDLGKWVQVGKFREDPMPASIYGPMNCRGWQTVVKISNLISISNCSGLSSRAG